MTKRLFCKNSHFLLYNADGMCYKIITLKPEEPMARMREAHREHYERKLWIINHSCSQMIASCLVSVFGTLLTLYLMGRF